MSTIYKCKRCGTDIDVTALVWKLLEEIKQLKATSDCPRCGKPSARFTIERQKMCEQCAASLIEDLKNSVYASDAITKHAKEQRDSMYRVAHVMKETCENLRNIIRRCTNELEGWKCALAFRTGNQSSHERLTKLIDDCQNAAPRRPPQDV